MEKITSPLFFMRESPEALEDVLKKKIRKLKKSNEKLHLEKKLAIQQTGLSPELELVTVLKKSQEKIKIKLTDMLTYDLELLKKNQGNAPTFLKKYHEKVLSFLSEIHEREELFFTSQLNSEKVVQEEKIKRLTAIGGLSARIAHDIRNPMSVIKNTLELLKMELDVKHNEKIQNKFERIDRAIIRINHQVENVLDSIRNKPLQFENTSLSSILNYVIDKINIPSDVTINLPKNDVKVFCDFEKLEVLFINLITNSIQAMDNEGKIDITVEEQQDHVLINVIDNGLGIPDELISKIFDPLFTTKETGTGLGLLSCQAIVKQHGGKIDVTSLAGKRTVFRIKLPKNLEIPSIPNVTHSLKPG